jgi:uncharacterized protein YecA (UPF0149 family)
MLKLNKEMYIQIARTQGVNAALTALHLDTERWEYEAFEGDKGWQPELWKDLNEVREFSRKLWQIALD